MPRAIRKPTTAAKRGRPLGEWVQHIPTILAAVASGETLTAVCQRLQIDASTVRQAYAADRPEGFQHDYARAREAQAEAWADEVVAEADRQGEYTKHGVDAGEIALRKLRVDTRKWLMARLHPRAYGERVDVTTQGERISGVVMLPPNENAPS